MQAPSLNSAFHWSQSMRMLHKTLNARRKDLKLTYEDVHAALLRRMHAGEVKPPSLAVIGHWFNGTRRPRNMEHLRALCGVLDLTLDEATGGAPHTAATASEQMLLDETRHLDESSVQLLLAMARGLRK